MKFKDYYNILGVERTASTADIKKAYRKLAHEYHPDVSKHQKSEEKFKEAAEAYATLKDPEKRAAYDELGNRRTGEDISPPPGWQAHFHDAGGQQFTSFDDVDLADLLAAFGARRHASGHPNTPRAAHGEDYEVIAPITVEQIYNGGEIDVNVALPDYDESGLMHRAQKTFRVKIPKGAQDGQRLRLPGKGGPGVRGGKNGDLYVVMTLAPHAVYRVSGHDLYIDLPLAPWEAALGAAVEVPTPGGPVELTVPPGTSSGQRLRLGRRGLPGAHEGAGDLFAVARIDVPKSVQGRERELFAELARTSTFNPRNPSTQGATS